MDKKKNIDNLIKHYIESQNYNELVYDKEINDYIKLEREENIYDESDSSISGGDIIFDDKESHFDDLESNIDLMQMTEDNKELVSQGSQNSQYTFQPNFKHSKFIREFIQVNDIQLNYSSLLGELTLDNLNQVSINQMTSLLHKIIEIDDVVTIDDIIHIYTINELLYNDNKNKFLDDTHRNNIIEYIKAIISFLDQYIIGNKTTSNNDVTKFLLLDMLKLSNLSEDLIIIQYTINSVLVNKLFNRCILIEISNIINDFCTHSNNILSFKTIKSFISTLMNRQNQLSIIDFPINHIFNVIALFYRLSDNSIKEYIVHMLFNLYTSIEEEYKHQDSKFKEPSTYLQYKKLNRNKYISITGEYIDLLLHSNASNDNFYSSISNITYLTLKLINVELLQGESLFFTLLIKIINFLLDLENCFSFKFFVEDLILLKNSIEFSFSFNILTIVTLLLNHLEKEKTLDKQSLFVLFEINEFFSNYLTVVNKGLLCFSSLDDCDCFSCKYYVDQSEIILLCDKCHIKTNLIMNFSVYDNSTNLNGCLFCQMKTIIKDYYDIFTEDHYDAKYIPDLSSLHEYSNYFKTYYIEEYLSMIIFLFTFKSNNVNDFTIYLNKLKSSISNRLYDLLLKNYSFFKTKISSFVEVFMIPETTLDYLNVFTLNINNIIYDCFNLSAISLNKSKPSLIRQSSIKIIKRYLEIDRHNLIFYFLYNDNLSYIKYLLKEKSIIKEEALGLLEIVFSNNINFIDFIIPFVTESSIKLRSKVIDILISFLTNLINKINNKNSATLEKIIYLLINRVYDSTESEEKLKRK